MPLETGQNTQYNVTPLDMQSPDLYRLNNALSSISGRIGTVESITSSVSQTIAGLASVTTSGASSVVTTHALRPTFSISAYNIGSFLTETDRNAVYQIRLVGSTRQWIFLTGIMRGTSVAPDLRPTDLGSNDTGFLFYGTDLSLLYRWSGSAWIRQDNYQPTLVATHSSRLAGFPSVRYTVGQEIFESDRTVRYVVADSSGTVTVAGGTNVTWTAGDHFVNTGSGFSSAQWPAGTPIIIGGLLRTVVTAAGPTTLTISSAVPNGAGQAYSVASGRWKYVSGSMAAGWASLPTDLGEADGSATGIGFVFNDRINSLHIWQWTGSAWTWGPGNRASGEMAEFDSDPGTGWHLCDGTGSLTKYAADGTRITTFTVPDRVGFYTLGWNAYSGVGTPAASPIAVNTGLVVSGITATGTAVSLNSSSAAVNAGAGAASTFLTTVTVATVTNPTISDPATITEPTIVFNNPIVPTFATLYYYRL